MIQWCMGVGPLVIGLFTNFAIAYAYYVAGKPGMTLTFMVYAVACVGFIWDMLR